MFGRRKKKSTASKSAGLSSTRMHRSEAMRVEVAQGRTIADMLAEKLWRLPKEVPAK